MRLLVVEDSPLLRKMFGLAFPHQSNELQPAENGRVALELLGVIREPFDAVLLDLRMPEMDGVQFIRALREHPVHRATPVIITTAEAEGSPMLAQASTLGVAAVVKKPWSPQALKNVVQRVLNTPRG